MKKLLLLSLWMFFYFCPVIAQLPQDSLLVLTDAQQAYITKKGFEWATYTARDSVVNFHIIEALKYKQAGKQNFRLELPISVGLAVIGGFLFTSAIETPGEHQFMKGWLGFISYTGGLSGALLSVIVGGRNITKSEDHISTAIKLRSE